MKSVHIITSLCLQTVRSIFHEAAARDYFSVPCTASIYIIVFLNNTGIQTYYLRVRLSWGPLIRDDSFLEYWCYLLVPLYSPRVFLYVGDERVLYLITGTGGHLENDLIKFGIAQDVDMVSSCPSAAWNGRRGFMRELRFGLGSVGNSDLMDLTYLYSDHFQPSRIPPLALPPFDTHSAETEEADRSVAFSHLHAVDDTGAHAIIGVVRVDPRLACSW